MKTKERNLDMIAKFFMENYVISFNDSKTLDELHVEHPASYRWVQIGFQEPFVTSKKWVDEHKALIKNSIREYRAYMIHDLFELLGDKFGALSRNGDTWHAIGGSQPQIDNFDVEATRPQDVLAQLFIDILEQ